MLTVNPSLPVKTFPEFIEYARKANPPLAYASGGNGSQHHLTMEMLKQRAGINLLHVPYKGGAPAAAATVAGDTAAMWSGSSNAPQIKAGRLRAARRLGRQAIAAIPGPADDLGVLPGLRELHLARPLRAGRNTRGHSQSAEDAK